MKIVMTIKKRGTSSCDAVKAELAGDKEIIELIKKLVKKRKNILVE